MFNKTDIIFKILLSEIIVSLKVLGTIIVSTELKHLLLARGKRTPRGCTGGSFSDRLTGMAASQLTFPEMVTTLSERVVSG